jgi:hypothetical protein
MGYYVIKELTGNRVVMVDENNIPNRNQLTAQNINNLPNAMTTEECAVIDARHNTWHNDNLQNFLVGYFILQNDANNAYNSQLAGEGHNVTILY